MRKIELLNSVLRKFRFEVLRHNENEISVLQNQYKWLQALKIRTVLDIGANVGSFSEEIHRILPESAIVAIEPLRECAGALRRIADRIPSMTVIQKAVGENIGEAEFFHRAFTPSSSLLPMDRVHAVSFPYSVPSSKERVSVSTLDALLEHRGLNSRILAKIDVQGYELRVLRGARKTLPRIDVFLIETSYFPLYKEQSYFREVFEYLNKRGFVFLGNFDQMKSPAIGVNLQGDAIFVNKETYHDLASL